MSAELNVSEPCTRSVSKLLSIQTAAALLNEASTCEILFHLDISRSVRTCLRATKENLKAAVQGGKKRCPELTYQYTKNIKPH